MIAIKKPKKKLKKVSLLTPARKRIVLQSLRVLNAKIKQLETTLLGWDFDYY
jgi:hypothetical protein